MKLKTDPRIKYKHHDIHIEDITEYDIDRIKELAVHDFVHTHESKQVPLIINSFMAYLTSNGYKIVKDEK